LRYTLWKKIFGIGLSKTGTWSLTDALNTLGHRVSHYTWPEQSVRERKLWRLYFAKDGGTDITVSVIFEKLDRIFPHSRFIYTERDRDAWLESMERHYDHRGEVPPIERELRIKMYGTDRFDRASLERAYHDHHRRVLHHFSQRPGKLLRLRICDGEGWEKLCPFLGIDRPETPFPHSNRAKQTR
jgi:hypothetical protein